MKPSIERMKHLLSNDIVQAGIITLFFAVGVVGHRFLPVWMEFLTPPVLWIYGLLVVVLAARTVRIDGMEESRVGSPSGGRPRRRLLLWVLLTYLITFTLEAVGTATGLIFGPYNYGDVLGFMVLSVPVVIGFNWVLVVFGALKMVERLPAALAVPGAAIITTGFDYLMEPIAVHLGYWTWYWDGIPPQNYLAWFVTSFVAAVGFRALRLRVPTRLPAFYLIIQSLFFLALRLINGV